MYIIKLLHKCEDEMSGLFKNRIAQAMDIQLIGGILTLIYLDFQEYFF